MAEIERAVITPPARLPGDVVALGSEVEFEDESSGARRRVRLVLPADADIESGMISILTPIGAGLIGMRHASGPFAASLLHCGTERKAPS